MMRTDSLYTAGLDDGAYGAKPVLVRRGKLRGAATSFEIWSIGETSATVRDLPPAVWYGKVHQAGYAGGTATSTKWFEPYRIRAKLALGPKATKSMINTAAMAIFDRRLEGRQGSGIFTPTKGEVNIPQRQFIMFQDQDIEAIQKIFYEWIDDQIVRYGKFVPGR
jgi:phage gpG-like protein